MCYSAQLEMNLKTLQRPYKARIAMEAFERLFHRRLTDDRIYIPKAMEANFYNASTPEEKRIKDLIDAHLQLKTKNLEVELFKQKKRLADAERTIQKKETKAAVESKRIATNKIQWHLNKIADLKRTELKTIDSRIFPFHYAPVFILEGDEYVIMPIRYHCRPAGKPEFYDRKFDGLYNARRDNLEGFWKGQFGHTHAFVVMSGFYENVAKHDFEHRELAPGEKPENLVLNFNPQPRFDMRVACLWSHWDQPGKPELCSFAAITDEPPPEVAATGHNRCVIPLKESNLHIWMKPQETDKQALYAVLDDRERPFYEHRLAA